MTTRQALAGAVFGTLLAVVGMFYIALITAVRGPVDWPSLIQFTLIFGPFATLCGVWVVYEWTR